MLLKERSLIGGCWNSLGIIDSEDLNLILFILLSVYWWNRYWWWVWGICWIVLLVDRFLGGEIVKILCFGVLDIE